MDFFSKCDQNRRNPRIWSYLLKKSLMENFIFLDSEWTNEIVLSGYSKIFTSFKIQILDSHIKPFPLIHTSW